MKVTNNQVSRLLQYMNKVQLAEELSISRPTLDKRLSGETPWKPLEQKWIKHLSN